MDMQQCTEDIYPRTDNPGNLLEASFPPFPTIPSSESKIAFEFGVAQIFSNTSSSHLPAPQNLIFTDKSTLEIGLVMFYQTWFILNGVWKARSDANSAQDPCRGLWWKPLRLFLETRDRAPGSRMPVTLHLALTAKKGKGLTPKSHSLHQTTW